MERPGFRFWMAMQKEALGLPLAVTAAVVVAAVVLLFVLPLTRSQPVTGIVVAIGPINGKMSLGSPAAVQVDDRLAKVVLRPNVDCRVGDRIMLRRLKARIGFTYGVGANPSPCSR